MTATVPLARRTLMHYRQRFLAALGGVVFAAVLLNMEIGIALGFLANSSSFITRLPGDIWIMAKDTPNFDMCHGIPESIAVHARSTPGVEWAEKMLVSWSIWRTGDGNEENVEVIGLSRNGQLSVPWPVNPTAAGKLLVPNGVLVDGAELGRLRIKGLGDTAEIMDKRFVVAGYTEGMRSFLTTPYCIGRIEDLGGVTLSKPGTVSYVLVKAASGVDVDTLQRRLRERLGHVDVLTAREFRRRTENYWLFGTGVGLALFATAFLGFLVAGAVVSQVLYALVIEQRPEFGMLKAIGANGAYLCRVVLGEAAIIAGAGYLLGIAATWPLVRMLCSGGVPILLSPGLVAAGFLAIATVCLIAAVMPLAKVLRLEPALVFRG